MVYLLFQRIPVLNVANIQNVLTTNACVTKDTGRQGMARNVNVSKTKLDIIIDSCLYTA